MMVKRKCEGCAFWHELVDSREGHCRRHAPAGGEIVGGPPIEKWPRTGGPQWCGEWKKAGPKSPWGD